MTTETVTVDTMDEADDSIATVGQVAAAGGKKGMLGLKECGLHDFHSPSRGKLTGWGAICKDRHDRGISKKQRRLKKQASQ